jgi:hypothetical protein
MQMSEGKFWLRIAMVSDWTGHMETKGDRNWKIPIFLKCPFGISKLVLWMLFFLPAPQRAALGNDTSATITGDTCGLLCIPFLPSGDQMRLADEGATH